MVGTSADCGSNAIDRVNHKFRAAGVAFAGIHTAYQAFLNPSESYALLPARLNKLFLHLELYRFGSIHNILVNLFREHPVTMHGHKATTW